MHSQTCRIVELDGESHQLKFMPEAPSGYPYHAYIEEIEILGVELDSSPDGVIPLRPVDAGDDVLVVQVGASVQLEVRANFEFSIRDSTDHDMIPIGSASGVKTFSVRAELLLTFEGLPENPQLSEVSVEYQDDRLSIDFDDVTGPESFDD